MVEKSCVALVIHPADDFRRKLIATLDQHHFAVTVEADGDSAIRALEARQFEVVLLGLNLTTRIGTAALDYLGRNRERIRCGVLLLGDADPAIRTCAPWVDETLLKPVDPAYVATRARTYCGC